MSSKIHTPVNLIPEKQAPLEIEWKMRWPQIWFGRYGEKKIILSQPTIQPRISRYSSM